MMVLEIIFQNRDFVIVYKPAETLSVPSRLGAADERICVGRLLESQLNLRIYPVHRLDYEVAGLLIFALNSNAQRLANRWFQDKVIRKIYTCCSEGKTPQGPTPLDMTWRNKLLRGKRRSYESPHGEWAETKAQFRGHKFYKEQTVLYWKLSPITGKSHQLRLHMSLHGFPILGDTLYGAQKVDEEKGIALWATQLDFRGVPLEERLGLPEVVDLPAEFVWGVR